MRAFLTSMLWRLAIRLRTRTFRLPRAGAPLSWIEAGAAAFGGRTRRIEEKIDRLAYDLLFVKQRMGTYLGDGIALTYLADETPILINSNDYGGPMELLGGGVYEQDNLDVLVSFLKPDSLVLDIGANLGIFSLKLARRLRGQGRVIAFEPHPFVRELMSRSVYMNGVRDRVVIHPFGLSDKAAAVDFQYPVGHLGGGAVSPASIGALVETTQVASEVRRLDDVLPPGTAVDIVKMDVEGHELAVLRGMRRVIAESPSIVILLEKLAPDAGYEEGIHALLAEQGLELFAVEPGALLRKIDSREFRSWSGYVLAARPELAVPLRRSFFSLSLPQVTVPEAVRRGADGQLSAQAGAILFQGPHWHLERGLWRIDLEGEVEGSVMLTLCERHAQGVMDLRFDSQTRSHRVYFDHDLFHFSIIARALSAEAAIKLDRLVFTRATELKEAFEKGPAEVARLGNRTN